MTTKNSTLKIPKQIEALLRSSGLNIVFAYLFGSRAKGEARQESDYDIAVFPRESLSARDRFELQQQLALALQNDVDLVDLTTANDVLRVQVIGDGKLIFSIDEPQREYFDMYALSDFARLNEERSAILDDFYQKRRG